MMRLPNGIETFSDASLGNVIRVETNILNHSNGNISRISAKTSRPIEWQSWTHGSNCRLDMDQ